jgi:autotransporter translocation and assembly factor TamB
VDGQFTGRLATTGLTDASVRGSITVDAGHLPAVAGTAARLDVWQDDWPALDSGDLHATLDVGGTLGSPTARGPVTVANLRAAGLGPLAATGALTVDPRQFAIRALDAAIGGSRLAGDIAVEGARDTFTGHLELALTDMHTLGDDVVNRWHPAGRLTAQIDLSGTASAPPQSPQPAPAWPWRARTSARSPRRPRRPRPPSPSPTRSSRRRTAAA